MTIQPGNQMGPDNGPIEPIDLTPKTNLGYYSLDPEEGTLAETDARCIECMRMVPGGGACPYDAGHVVEPLHVAKVGLGYANDSDFYNWDAEQFEYPAVSR